MSSDRGADKAQGTRGPRDNQAAADRATRPEEQADEEAYAICAMNACGWVTW